MIDAEDDRRKYIRTCQECGHKQEERPPALYMTDGWMDVKCKRCKSEGLDYGSWTLTKAEKAELDAQEGEE